MPRAASERRSNERDEKSVSWPAKGTDGLSTRWQKSVFRIVHRASFSIPARPCWQSQSGELALLDIGIGLCSQLVLLQATPYSLMHDRQ